MKMGIRRGKKIFAPTFTAIIAIATALTFSACGGDDGGICEGDECGVGGISSSSINAGGGGKGNNIANYNTKTIGTQVWMAENLNYDVPGSRCYSNSDSNCDTYGRLYDWSTAMALPASCNSSACASQVSAKHRGICPAGWHIPTNAEWNELYHYADGTLTVSTNLSSNYDSPTAGRYLKSVTGWNSYSGIVNEDSFGFAALPGGYGSSGGDFDFAGLGYWWSSSEYDESGAYFRYMYYGNEGASWDDDSKALLFSVRCLQD